MDTGVRDTGDAPHESGRTTPAKIILERRVRSGDEAAFDAWAHRYVAAASRHAGHEGSSVLSFNGSGHQFILLRFRSSADLDRWQRSDEHAVLWREADDVSVAGGGGDVRSGMETWFTLADRPAPAGPPPKWKMALVTWACLLPMVVALSFALAPLGLPFAIDVVVSTAIPVVMLTWVLMPRVTRALYAWLYVHSPIGAATGSSIGAGTPSTSG